MAEEIKDIHTLRFLGLVDTLNILALSFLGKVANPESGEVQRNLPMAQMYIEFLAALEKRTEGNLDELESRHLERVLANLRLNYVDEAEAAKREAAKEAEAEEAGEKDEKQEEKEKKGEGES